MRRYVALLGLLALAGMVRAEPDEKLMLTAIHDFYAKPGQFDKECKIVWHSTVGKFSLYTKDDVGVRVLVKGKGARDKLDSRDAVGIFDAAGKKLYVGVTVVVAEKADQRKLEALKQWLAETSKQLDDFRRKGGR